MRKIFRNYMAIIITIAILTILITNFFMIATGTRNRQLSTFNGKIDQVIHLMEENKIELEAINRNLDEDYLTRARAAAYVIERNPEVVESVEELQNLAGLLNVDEVHVIDENGIIIYSSVPIYIGVDFHDGEQTRGFLWLLEDESGTACFAQEAQPNSAEQKIMKYVGVTREGKRGIIQVGLRPTRLQEAQERNTYQYIFERFPTDVGQEYFAIDCNTNQILAHSGNMPSEQLTVHNVEHLKGCESGGFRTMEDGDVYYVVTRQYGDVLIGTEMPRDIMYRSLSVSIFTVFLYLFLIEIVIILLMDYLLKRKVVDGIYRILGNLNRISNGNYDTVVNVGGNPEFEELSSGIQTMVKSILSSSDRISKIIEMSEIPLAAFEYQTGMKYVFITSGLGDILGISKEELEQLYRDPALFLAKIQRIMEVPAEGETDVFPIKDKYVRIHLSVNGEGYLGVATDATREVLESRRIRYENDHDQLTGLCKYNYFKQRAEEALKSNPEKMACACVMLDLDDFKKINDTYGHDLGDIYLQNFAEIMKTFPREHCITARRSGDEFCLLLHGYSKETILRELNVFWNILREKRVGISANEEIEIHASGGIAFAGEKDMDLSVLMHQADVALYQAKDGQKGYYVEYEEDNLLKDGDHL